MLDFVGFSAVLRTGTHLPFINLRLVLWKPFNVPGLSADETVPRRGWEPTGQDGSCPAHYLHITCAMFGSSVMRCVSTRLYSLDLDGSPSGLFILVSGEINLLSSKS